MEGSNVEVWAIAEAHLLKDQLAGLERQGLKGRNIFGSPASPKHKGTTELGKLRSSHGGVLMLPMKGLACTTMGGAKGSNGLKVGSGIGANQEIMLMVAYLEPSVGPTGANLERVGTRLGGSFRCAGACFE